VARRSSRSPPPARCSLRSPVFVQSPGGSSKYDAQGMGMVKQQGQLQNFSSLQSPNDFLPKVPKALFWIQCFSHSLEASGQGERGGEGWEEGQRTGPCSCQSNREVFSLNTATSRLDKQPSMHTSMRAHAHACPSSPPSQPPLPITREPQASISKGCAFYVFPKSHSSKGDTTPYASQPPSGLQIKL